MEIFSGWLATKRTDAALSCTPRQVSLSCLKHPA
jgi:hypothetical protein